MIFVDWGDLFDAKRLADGDVLTAVDEGPAADGPGFTQFGLELAPHKTWWKGLQALDNTDGQIGFVEVANNTRGPIWQTCNNLDIEVGGKICLWKAKTFGIHTPMYIVAGLESPRVRGRRIRLRWSAD